MQAWPSSRFDDQTKGVRGDGFLSAVTESNAEVREEREAMETKAEGREEREAHGQAAHRLGREAWRPRRTAPLPYLSLDDDDLCFRLDAWVQTAECNGTPGEGSRAWEEHIREMAGLFPGSVVDESTDESDDERCRTTA